MEKLFGGIARFHKHALSSKHQDLFERPRAGPARPDALFITCADSRIDPCLITQTKPGELFICRVIGNIVLPFIRTPSAACRQPLNTLSAYWECPPWSFAATPIAES